MEKKVIKSTILFIILASVQLLAIYSKTFSPWVTLGMILYIYYREWKEIWKG